MKRFFKYVFLLVFFFQTSCAIHKPQPIASVDTLDRAKTDLKKIENIKEINKEFREGTEIDLYTAIALAINNNKDLKVKISES